MRERKEAKMTCKFLTHATGRMHMPFPRGWRKVVEGRVYVVITQKCNCGMGTIPLVEPYQIREADKK